MNSERAYAHWAVPRWLFALLLLMQALPALALRVSIVPTSATLEPGLTEQFDAAVAGSANTAVRWRVNGVVGGNATIGTITVDGVYTAPALVPASGRVAVSAVSKQDPARVAAARVWLVQPQVHVSIAPSSIGLGSDQTAQFETAIANASGATLIWRVNGINGGNTALGRISASGLYTAPSQAPRPSIVIVTAIVREQPSAMAIARIHLGGPPTIYVATGGDDGNDGSIDTPLRTIQRAADISTAGDTIQVAGGVYNELVKFPRGGTEAGDITLHSAPGETAIIDGTGLSIPEGQNGLVTIPGKGFVVVSGFEMRNYRSATQAVPIGIYVRGAAHDVQLLGNRIHAIRTTAPAGSANAFGLLIAGDALTAIRNVTVRGNEIDHTTTGNSETLSVNGNVTDWTIADNLVHDTNNIGIDAIGYEGTAPSGAVDRAREGRILRNAVYHITSYHNPAYGTEYAAGGIYVDGGYNVLIGGNAVHDTDLGLEFASEHAGRFTRAITANNNLVWHSHSAGISIGGASAANGGVRNCTIVNNTLFENDTALTGSGEFQVQHFAGNNRFLNNIVHAGAQALFVNAFTSDSDDPAEVNFNLFYSTQAPADTEWVWSGQDYHSFAAWRTGTGQDADSAYLDPLPGDAGLPYLKPQAGSPAVGAGMLLDAGARGTRDVAGTARVQGLIDIGAYERP